MKITEVKYMRRFNLGNYEHEEIAMTAVLDEKDGHSDSFKKLKADVIAAYSGEAAPSTEKVTPTLSKSAAKLKKEAAAAEEEEVDEDETPADPEDDEETDEAEESEEEEEADVEEPKQAKGKKTFKKKPQAYSRASEQHKEIFSSLLKSVAPDWKKTPDSKEKGKAVSQKMEGEEFLDESGEVLPEFKAAVKSFMAPAKKKK